MKWKNFFLIAGLIELGIGFSDASPNVFFYLGRPVGAILLCLYGISGILEKASAPHDGQNPPEELEPKSSQTVRNAAPSNRPSPKSGHGFDTAHAH